MRSYIVCGVNDEKYSGDKKACFRSMSTETYLCHLRLRQPRQQPPRALLRLGELDLLRQVGHQPLADLKQYHHQATHADPHQMRQQQNREWFV